MLFILIDFTYKVQVIPKKGEKKDKNVLIFKKADRQNSWILKIG